MAPAHPHATGVAVYPALFIFLSGKLGLDLKDKIYAIGSERAESMS